MPESLHPLNDYTDLGWGCSNFATLSNPNDKAGCRLVVTCQSSRDQCLTSGVLVDLSHFRSSDSRFDLSASPFPRNASPVGVRRGGYRKCFKNKFSEQHRINTTSMTAHTRHLSSIRLINICSDLLHLVLLMMTMTMLWRC